jgi:hypothetical protein
MCRGLSNVLSRHYLEGPRKATKKLSGKPVARVSSQALPDTTLARYRSVKNVLKQGCINPGRQVVVATEFGTVARNVFGSSVGNLLYVTFLVPRILRWFLDFWKMI